jgi:hypothetical protein
LTVAQALAAERPVDIEDDEVDGACLRYCLTIKSTALANSWPD